MDRDRLAAKYHGDMAKTYDELREGTPQWLSEHRIVERFLSRFGPGTSILDVPVGTGRFLQTYATLGFEVTGVDVSTSMLAKARRKVASHSLDVRLHEGSIYSLDFADGAFDVVVCIRFMDWVKGEVFERALTELVRVSKDAIIVYIPTYTPFLDIEPWSITGLMRLLRQWKFRFYNARTRSDIVIHERNTIRKLFDRLGLRIADRVCVDSPSGKFWRMGDERDIYLLQKSN